MNKLVVTVVSWTVGTALGLLLANKLFNKPAAPTAPPTNEQGDL